MKARTLYCNTAAIANTNTSAQSAAGVTKTRRKGCFTPE
jgi:hypothetical protein